MSAFMEAVADAAKGTPYTVVPHSHGFDVQLDTSAQWWDLLSRIKMRRSFRWRVRERGDGRTFTITDRQIDVDWQAGVPTLNYGSSFTDGWNWSTLSWDGEMSFNTGRILEFSRVNIWALSDRGRIEQVVNYKFNAREGRDLIRLVAKQLGLRERQPALILLSWLVPTLALIAGSVAYFAHAVLSALGH